MTLPEQSNMTMAERWDALQRHRAEDLESRADWERWQREMVERDHEMRRGILLELRKITTLLAGAASWQDSRS